jgi:hypothetical protein
MTRSSHTGSLTVILVSSAMILAAMPFCAMGHCGMTMERAEMAVGAGGVAFRAAAAVDCCTASCPMGESESCDSMATEDDSTAVPATAATVVVRVPAPPAAASAPAAHTLGAARSRLCPSHGAADGRISPPIHLLNSQFLI